MKEEIIKILKSTNYYPSGLYDEQAKKDVGETADRILEAVIKHIDMCPKTDFSDTECEDTYDEGYENCLQDIKDSLNG